MSLYGDYLGAQGEQAPFDIAHGYSKDKRPDLKQFVLSLLCVDGNVPIVGKLEDGNASDKTINHRLLSEVRGHMHKHGVAEDAFIYIADSAMVTAANLEQIGERTRFITRLPATYNEHERVILNAIEADDWEDVGRIAQTAPTQNRPGASYRVHEGAVTLYGKDYRAVVVHYMVTWKFKGVLVLCVGEQRLLARPLTDTQLAFLQVLQVPESCFAQHPRDG